MQKLLNGWILVWCHLDDNTLIVLGVTPSSWNWRQSVRGYGKSAANVRLLDDEQPNITVTFREVIVCATAQHTNQNEKK